MNRRPQESHFLDADDPGHREALVAAVEDDFRVRSEAIAALRKAGDD